MLGGLCCDKMRIYNTCAGYQYVRSNKIGPVNTWNIGDEGPYEDLDGFMTDAGRAGREPARAGHHRHEDLALRSGGGAKPEASHLGRGDEGRR